MTLTLFKITAAILIFFLTLLAGIIPLHFVTRNEKAFHLSDSFASGIFLSAAMLHFLPYAETTFTKIYGTDSYPVAQLYCVISFIGLMFMERGIAMYSKHHADRKNKNLSADDSNYIAHKNLVTPILMLAVLSIHSLIEGAAIGISTNFAEAILIFIAIVVHKGTESLALVSNLYRYALKFKNINRLATIFSLMTPLGILLATLVNNTIDTATGKNLAGIFNAVAAGTFLYLGSVHIMECRKSFEDFGEIISLILGIALMSVISIWV